MTDAPPDAAARAALMNNSEALAERLGAGRYDLTVVSASALGPTMRHVVLGAPALAEFTHEPGQDLMLSLGESAGHLVRRRYTIRDHDTSAATVAIDAVIHGDGPGARWFADAAPGDRIEAIGPRGKVVVDPDAEWHLFVGDDSFVPAASVMAAAVDQSRSAWIIAEVDDPDSVPPVDAPALDSAPQWMRRDGGDPSDPGTLLGALADWTLPDTAGFAYLGGEFHLVTAVRDALVERGVDGGRISAKPYWRADQGNGNHGEPERS